MLSNPVDSVSGEGRCFANFLATGRDRHSLSLALIQTQDKATGLRVHFETNIYRFTRFCYQCHLVVFIDNH